ncbi:hypothetical protein B7494_g6469 [Chlorociboria aeruginascens]|nr:hypothetical protein B7494_g6469 [Chlorociboria aeruginascens]
MEDQRQVELDCISAIFPEIVVDDQIPFAASIQLPVNPQTPVKVVTLPAAYPTEPSLPDSAIQIEKDPPDVESHSLSHLPPLNLSLFLPEGYPETRPPNFKLTTEKGWLPQEHLSEMESEGQRMWEEAGGDQVVFGYIDFLQQAAENAFGYAENGKILEVHQDNKISLLDYNIQATQAAFDKETFDCGICLDPKKGSACHRMMDCGHVFCVQCLQDFYNNAITEGDLVAVRCLAPDCAKKRAERHNPTPKKSRKLKTQISPSELLQIPLESEMVTRYVHLKHKAELESDKNTIYCPRKWCQGAARSKKHRKPQGFEEVDSSDEESDTEGDWGFVSGKALLAICEDCSFAFCSRCSQGWHGEFKSCAPKRSDQELTEEEKASLEYLQLHTTPCPTCSAPSQKTHGCNHMICFKCQSHFCYLCSAWLQATNPYEHYNTEKTPCYMRLWELEGGDGDNVGIGYAGGVQAIAIEDDDDEIDPPILREQGPNNFVDEMAFEAELANLAQRNAQPVIAATEEPEVELEPVQREGPLVLRINPLPRQPQPPPAPAPAVPNPVRNRRNRGPPRPQPIPNRRGQAEVPARGGGNAGRPGPALGDERIANQQPARRAHPVADAAWERDGDPVGNGQGWVQMFVQMALNDEEDLLESDDDDDPAAWEIPFTYALRKRIKSPELTKQVHHLQTLSPHSPQKCQKPTPSLITTRSATILSTPPSSLIKSNPYASLTIGIPRETYTAERRVALTPQNTALLLKKGFSRVLIERGAGVGAQFPDAAYEAVGATIVSRGQIWKESDIVLKVRAPSLAGAGGGNTFGGEKVEIDMLREGMTIISFMYPRVNIELVEELSKRGVTAFAMDMIPRISRAQVFDALSSMANISGYKAVLEASNHFGRFMTGQVTAAGKVPPCKILVIGAGVAGLSAIATARRLGAIVRGFDTRSAAREQVQSLGAEFIEVDIKEEGAGTGGYGKEMSKEFIEAEMKLFMQQCKDVDIVITTALIPGRPAPKLITEEMVAAMKPGSVIVDLAAEAGGNCVKTVPGQMVEHKGVKIIGYTDLPSRLPTQSSTLYSNNITKFLLSISPQENSFGIDLEDEVVRGSITILALAALAATAFASPAPAPQGVASAIAPDASAPAGCSGSFNSQFQIEVISVVAKRDVAKRASDCGASGSLTLTLADTILKDEQDRIGSIVANHQFQFDGPVAQDGAIYTAGWSTCSNGSLALGGSTVFYRCLSGTFYNLYDENIGEQCEPIGLYVLPCAGSSAADPPAISQSSDGQALGTAAPSQIGDGQVQVSSGIKVSQITDGQLQVPTATPVPVTQISDGQVQAPTGTPVTQISDGQVQAPTGTPITQISDGQVQAPTGTPVTQITDGQVQAPTGIPVTQITDGQVQAGTTVAPVTQISDGQVQAPTGAVVTQIGDGQVQSGNATTTPLAVTGAASSLITVGSQFAAAVIAVVAVAFL